MKKSPALTLTAGIVVLAFVMAHPILSALLVLVALSARTAFRLARFYVALAGARAACRLAAVVSLGHHRPKLSQHRVDRAFMVALIGGRPSLVGAH